MGWLQKTSSIPQGEFVMIANYEAYFARIPALHRGRLYGPDVPGTCRSSRVRQCSEGAVKNYTLFPR